MPLHEYPGADGVGVPGETADHQVELNVLDSHGYHPRQQREEQQQRRRQQEEEQLYQELHQQEQQQDRETYQTLYERQQDDSHTGQYSYLAHSNHHSRPMGPTTDFSRPLTSPRQTPVYQSAHTSSTAVNSDDYIASPTWAANMQHSNSGFLTESHDAYASWSGYSSPRNSGRASAADLAYLKGHRSVPSLLDSRPASPNYNQSRLTLTGLSPQTPEPTLNKDWIIPSTVASVHDRDDADIWKGWRRFIYRFVPYLTVLNMSLYVLYLGLRIACIVSAQKHFHSVFAAAWLFVAVEVATAVPSLLHNSWTVMSIRKRKRSKLRLMGDEVPSVDVFITCCKEDDDVVLDTVRATCDLDYPRDRFRVIVLDDGKVETLGKAVENLSATYPNLYYIARPKYPGVPHHFKAGNLNHGLNAVYAFPGGAGEYMAALDADMIPERQWLRAVLPHLVADPKMALACPPQLFYNTPPGDPLAQSLDFFVHVIEPIKDTMGVAWCTGSGYVARRAALDEIGNFPLGSLAEDVATSTKMLGMGWKTAFVHEPLQFGTVPEDFASHLKQRTRWAIGTVQTSFKLNFCLWGSSVRQMTFAQRFSGFLYASLSLYTILLTISLFAIPIILIMGKQLVAYSNETQLRWLVRACFAATICNRLCEFVLFIPAGYHTGQRGSRYQLWMSPYIALCLIRSFVLPRWLGGQAQAFTPTGSITSTLNERDPTTRKNLVRRLFIILFNYMGWFHLAFVYLTLVGVTMSTYRCFFWYTTVKTVLQGLVTHAFWPPLTFLFICSSMWTPIAYAIEPPSMPDREQLLNRDPKTGVAHPTEQAKNIAFNGLTACYELEYTMTTATRHSAGNHDDDSAVPLPALEVCMYTHKGSEHLYASHFLSSRLFEFGSVLFLAAIYPDTLMPVAVSRSIFLFLLFAARRGRDSDVYYRGFFALILLLDMAEKFASIMNTVCYA
ncbi:glycosyl transferase, family 2 [Niveomyces insectorum RCEF 264]|uniref:Glycosyl transferase, family 2 n=1 Tax=Niveomyces insectorum RCEF 264 TaxID=1081102 RepID=A0A162MD00_9HYPO|nr:glycosyl transferase, family 2 [Niveomyces insectorum RCEF 264]